ncbi:ROK family protein [Corynebacterium timonense]|uniref:Transcriptional regulator n=1 Tax=Corynebacterium timonense TaxID=441500 RepID=A0A1H1NB55_9CORY|nr:ROK family protein [Corynebacterium timonense]SDR96157.1 transcriptional regulator [Corynebacterium timonense]
MTASASLAVDIGGTKIAYGVVADDSPTVVLAEGKVASQPAGRTLAEQLDLAIARAAEALPLPVARVGVGSPGVVLPPEGQIVSAGPTVPGWAGTDIAAIVHRYLDVPVYAHNDVRIWAWGEHHLGVGTQFPGRVLYLALGTGVGGAIVDEGELLAGPTGTAGEFSELVAPDFRGLADRVENIASGPSLARYYDALSRPSAENHAEPIPWEDPAASRFTLRDVIAFAEEGDVLAQSIIEGNLAGLGRSIGGVVSAFDISAVVLGGGVCGIGPLVTEPIRRGIRAFALAPNRDVPVVTSTFGADAPLVCAAAFARSHHANCSTGKETS